MNLDQIWDCIDEANSIVDIDLRRSAIEDSIHNLKNLIFSGNVQGWYPLGYAYYCHPDRQVENSIAAIETVRSLENAIRNNIEVPLAHLYLAFHFFDYKEFEKAGFHIDQIKEGELDETMLIRLRELDLCISILKIGLENSIVKIDSYINFIVSLIDLAVPPIILINVLEDILSKTLVSQSVHEVLHRLDHAYPVLGQKGFTRFLN